MNILLEAFKELNEDKNNELKYFIIYANVFDNYDEDEYDDPNDIDVEQILADCGLEVFHRSDLDAVNERYFVKGLEKGIKELEKSKFPWITDIEGIDIEDLIISNY